MAITKEFFLEEITFDGGLEIHNFTLNKKLVYEEENLIKLIVILSLYERRIRNIHFAMEEVGKGKCAWFTDILIADKRVEGLISNNADDNSQELTTVINQILQSIRKSMMDYAKNSEAFTILCW